MQFVLCVASGKIVRTIEPRSEGGGHRGSFLRSPGESLMGGFALIPQVVDIVKLPVIAAGGSADGRGLAGAFALGARGGRSGTAFLRGAGSGGHEAFQNALSTFSANRKALTDAL